MASPSPSRFGHVPALDGLRGLAVLAVIAYHLTLPSLGGGGLPLVGGGFLGVDLFFVLSGFLITSLLLHEGRANGRVNLTAFWLRRARRLLPALFLLLAAVVTVGATYSPMQKGTLRWDIISAIGYVINWRFVITGQSYFDGLVAPSPLRHLWSLAIEEQFYLLWPLLVAGALLMMRRGGRRAVPGALAVLIAAIGCSAVVLAVTYRLGDPSRAYYGTDSRVHELLIGAVAAVVAYRRATGNHRDPQQRWIGWAPLAGLAVVLVLVVTLSDKGAVYYRGGSVLFSVAAAVVMVGVLDGRALVARVLRVRPLVYVGTISYGLYLWHWPAIVWLSQERTGLSGPALAGVRLGATVGVALVSFYVLERPAQVGVLRPLTRAPRFAAISVMSCVAVLVAGTAVATRGAQDIPHYLTGKQTAGEQQSGLGNQQGAGTPRPIALIGDSVARNFIPAFHAEAAKRGRASIAFGFGGCSSGDLQRTHGDGKPLFGFAPTYCLTEHSKVWREKVKEVRPEIVFWHSRRDGYNIRDNDGKLLLAGSPEWIAAEHAEWDRLLKFLTDNGATTLVLILPAYLAGETPKCESGNPREARTIECGATADKDGFMGMGPLLAAYRSWARTHDKDHDNLVRTVELNQWVCPQPPGKPCPFIIDGLQMRIEDNLHFTDPGRDWLVPKIFDQVLPIS